MASIDFSNDLYTYRLKYPDGTVFYVGKATASYDTSVTSEHFAQHLREARKGVQSPKCDVIREIESRGKKVIFEKVHENMTQKEAVQDELDLIKFYGIENLTNKVSGERGSAWRERSIEEKLKHKEACRLGTEKRKAKRQAKGLLYV